MAKFEKGNSLGKKFSKDHQPESNGRRPKMYTILKDKGYSINDITAATGEMAFYNEQELREVVKDKNLPIICRIVAGNYLRAFRNESVKDLEHILLIASSAPPASESQNQNPHPPDIVYKVLPPEED